MKIRIECNVTVFVDVKVTAKQLRQLEANELSIDQVIDDSVAYRAIATDGEFDYPNWEPITGRLKVTP